MTTKTTTATTALQRCPWAGISDPEYARYHDEEWGVPMTDETRLFEKMVLEGFQSGLSWLTILKKRDNFRRAFHGFDATRIALFDEKDIARLLSDSGIVRHRGKIEAAISNAKALVDLHDHTTLTALVWDIVGGRPQIHERQSFIDIPAQTDLSKRLSKALKAKGFRFVGPTTAYAFMQSTGMVNDHVVTCHRHAVCAGLQRDFGGSPTHE